MEERKIIIRPIAIEQITVKIVGTSPYLPEPMDMAVVERYNKKKSNQVFDKDNMSEEEKVKEKYYYTETGVKGIPARAFYKAMIRASSYLFEKKDGGMRNIKEGITVEGDILPIAFKSEEVLTHWGRTSGSSRSPRKILRNAFKGWECELSIKYNSEHLTADQICNILNWAGFHIGIGAFRKENTGNYGAFMVKDK